MYPLQQIFINSKGESRRLKLAIAGTTQCVGFARHWLEKDMLMTFSDIENADAIWQKITFFLSLSDNRKHPVINRINGFSKAPQYGDLIIYSRHLDTNGHVAVVTAVDEKNRTVSVAEQNYMNCYQSPDTHRNIPYIKTNNHFRLLQNHILGWKHISPNNSCPI